MDQVWQEGQDHGATGDSWGLLGLPHGAFKGVYESV
jgi:hypothetical protein